MGADMVVVGTWNLENLYRPGSQFGPTDQAAYGAKRTTRRLDRARARITPPRLRACWPS